VTNPFTEQRKDRIAGLMIRVGGGLVIALVVGMMANIAFKALPLFLPATAGPLEEVAGTDALAVGCGSQQRVTWWVGSDGYLHQRPTPPHIEPVPIVTEGHVLAADHEIGGVVSMVSSDGVALVGRVRVERLGPLRDGIPQVRWRELVEIGRERLGFSPLGITATADGDGTVLAAVWGTQELTFVVAQGRDVELRPGPEIDGIAAAALDDGLENIAIVDRSGRLRLYRHSDMVELNVEGLDRSVARIRFLVGGRTLVVAAADGSVHVLLAVPRVAVSNHGHEEVSIDSWTVSPGHTLVVPDDDVAYRLAGLETIEIDRADPEWRVVRTLPSMGGRPTVVAPAHRDRGFMVGDDTGRVALYHATSGRRLLRDRWLEQAVAALSMAPRGDGGVAASEEGVVCRTIRNPHPEISLRTLFLPVWYEGYAAPRQVWQTSGGSDTFEPKFGLWPLLFGTLKATFYAMVFSVPLAQMAAIYVSQLAPSWLQGVVKPTVELMAAVPSVVVGFLAALWLAPRLELWLFPSLVVAATLPLAVFVALAAWRGLPVHLRQRMPRGSELVFLLASAAVVIVGAVLLAGPLEGWLFGGDFQRFLFGEWGIRYDQRNSLVVGLALGFAVIPVIFTIAEDACSGVPATLVQAARALGATRWQAAVRLVVPAASPGLFAAVMLGLGRAVGETMIVLMASGNTPILDLSPFNGMRTMSAAIAFEVPEAPVEGTLFRVLFLTGLLLFVLSLFFTTAADAVGRRLRRRYARF
jgi:ABC-type uncharacterized transport system permease subunit